MQLRIFTASAVYNLAPMNIYIYIYIMTLFIKCRWLLVKAMLFVMSQILLAMKLQGSIVWAWTWALSPIFVLEGLYLIEKMITSILGYRTFIQASEAEPHDKAALVHFFCRDTCLYICSLT
jgi:hypothetical protein